MAILISNLSYLLPHGKRVEVIRTSPSTPSIRAASSKPDFKKWVSVFRSKSINWAVTGAFALGLSLNDDKRVGTPLELKVKYIALMGESSSTTCWRGWILQGELSYEFFVGLGFADAKVGVNKPELLPKEFSPVIDVAGFLSAGQENRLVQEIIDLEKDTGFKLRVLAQNYPETPGLAVRDYWQVDDRTIVFVVDPTFGNILNFNVGASVDLSVPRNFWSRVAGKYGNMFYRKEKGEDASVEDAVTAILNCLREPAGLNNCSEVR